MNYKFSNRIADSFNGLKYTILLWFTRDPVKRKALLIASALCSLEGRKLLEEAMAEPMKPLIDAISEQLLYDMQPKYNELIKVIK